MTPRVPVAVAAFLAWTAFVWVGRIRNAVTDPALSGWDLWGPLLLSLSFVVPTVWLAAELVVSAARRTGAPPRFSTGLAVLVVWTAGVWVVRAGDIVVGGDHQVGFVVVHVVLAVVSISSGALALVADRRSRRRPRRSAVAAS